MLLQRVGGLGLKMMLTIFAGSLPFFGGLVDVFQEIAVACKARRVARDGTRLAVTRTELQELIETLQAVSR